MHLQNIYMQEFPADTRRRRSAAESLLNIDQALGQSSLFAGMSGAIQQVIIISRTIDTIVGLYNTRFHE